MNRDAMQKVCDEITEIMRTYREQDEQGDIDTPGGLEHMGDVWHLLRQWDEMLHSENHRKE